MSFHQHDLDSGADDVDNDDDDETVSVHGEAPASIEVDELHMNRLDKTKNPKFKRNSLVSNFHRNQKEEDEREMCELRARQAERYKRERDKLSDANEGSESLGNQDGSESGSDNDLINGNWMKERDGMVRVKIEGEIRKPQFDTGLVHESQVSKPRHRGAVVGNGSTMKLKERQQVRKKSSVRCWQLECVDLIGYQPHPSLCPRQI